MHGTPVAPDSSSPASLVPPLSELSERAFVMNSIHRRTGALLMALAVPISGCGHSFYVVGRTTGTQGTARVVTAGNHSGSISLDVAGKVYSGRWVYAPGGGSVGVGTAIASSGMHIAMASNTMIGLPMGGDGSILASAADGSTIRCAFQYSEWGSTGVGVCQDSADKTYDLQIN